jgi:hypothetical protein
MGTCSTENGRELVRRLEWLTTILVRLALQRKSTDQARHAGMLFDASVRRQGLVLLDHDGLPISLMAVLLPQLDTLRNG